MRIQNLAALASVGWTQGRKAALDIVDAGLTASDPYYNTRQLIRLTGTRLEIGCPDFEAAGDPQSGTDVYDVGDFDHIYVVGAGKGVQRIAKAIEDALGDYVTGGHVIAKYGDPVILDKVGVTLASHPTPDANCQVGCMQILEVARRVTERDLVFTIITNGGSSLMTLPVPGVPLEDVTELTRLMQIEMGMPTRHLNKIRNHIDQLKGGKLARAFCQARLVNIAGVDLNHADDNAPADFDYFVNTNCWLHNMPEGSTYQDARDVLTLYGAWDKCPQSVVDALNIADPAGESVRYEEYKAWKCRMFGVMPESRSFYKVALDRAAQLGYAPYLLADSLTVEAREMGYFLSAMARCVQSGQSAIKPPCALVLTGEMVVTVGKSREVGGRNQECALAFASRIAGIPGIVLASADTDGTDGPGGLDLPGAPSCLAGGVVDGQTGDMVRRAGMDIHRALNSHATSKALWAAGCGIHAQQGISLNDLIVVLIDKRV